MVEDQSSILLNSENNTFTGIEQDSSLRPPQDGVACHCKPLENLQEQWQSFVSKEKHHDLHDSLVEHINKNKTK